jgi:hypothetical protein
LVNGAKIRLATAWLAGVAVLIAAAWLRGAEYDEQYTLFLTAGVPRPAWPEMPFPAGLVQAMQTGHAGLLAIVRNLRTSDVHPPLYFWLVAVWRRLVGPTLLAARLLSALFGAASLALVGRVAWMIRASSGGGEAGPAPAGAILMTALCYGFAYTNAVARGFAPAETATLLGVLLLLQGRPGWAGPAFGAACACNYLAVFPAIAACVVTRAWRALPGAVPFLALDVWCFAAQHGSRGSQFPPFALIPSSTRLAAYQVAAVFGGLPLYWDGSQRVLVAAIVALATLVLLAQVVMGVRSTALRPMRGRSVRLLLLTGAVTPALGLLLLGFVFDNAPIELRYLGFGLPFLALLASGPGFGDRPILLVQAAGIAGLLLAPRTMQPAREAARDAVPFSADALALLPAGNDGVGIVGAFGIEAPPGLMLSLIRPAQPIVIPLAFHRVILVLIGQDRDSRAVLPPMEAAVAGPNWRRIATGSNLEVYERLQSGG